MDILWSVRVPANAPATVARNSCPSQKGVDGLFISGFSKVKWVQRVMLFFLFPDRSSDLTFHLNYFSVLTRFPTLSGDVHYRERRFIFPITPAFSWSIAADS
jgi:hypothetical protein